MVSSAHDTLAECEMFLKSPECDWDGVQALHLSRRSSRWSNYLKSHWILFLHFLFVIFNIILLLLWASSPMFRSCQTSEKSKGDSSGGIFSPAHSAIHYGITEVETIRTSSRFTGPPRPEVDQAWSELLSSTMVRVSEDEMKRLEKTSIALRDGSGYVGYLETYHMLHCIKRLYQAQYPDYYPDLQGVNALSTGHFDHCIEVIRQGVMCNAETKVNTFFWNTPTEIKGNTTGKRSCADWSQIEAWADARRIEFQGAGAEDFLQALVPSDDIGTMGPF